MSQDYYGISQVNYRQLTAHIDNIGRQLLDVIIGQQQSR